jgi:hypothetical protein
MLRHSAGYALAGRGVDTRTWQAFMGHRSIANTVIYTAVADKRVAPTRPSSIDTCWIISSRKRTAGSGGTSGVHHSGPRRSQVRLHMATRTSTTLSPRA